MPPPVADNASNTPGSLSDPHPHANGPARTHEAASATATADPPALVNAFPAIPTHVKKPVKRSRFREYGLPLILLLVSIVTVTANGARFMQNFIEGLPPVVKDSDLWPWGWLAEHPSLWRTGWTFSGSLLGILLIHEFGHYFACRWHRIRATLPWVLPAPTLSGTAGAIIKLRNRIPTRNALLDVGFYGPIAGFIASCIAVAAGFNLSYAAPADAPIAIVRFGPAPIIIRLIHALVAHGASSTPTFEHAAPHPVLIAGWIGFFITSLNLIPGGQLDGGHILYSISPKIHKAFTNVLPFALFVLGIFFWVGWILWGTMLMIPMMRHPQVPTIPRLTTHRYALAILGLLLFVLTFSPMPFHNSSLLHFFHLNPLHDGQ